MQENLYKTKNTQKNKVLVQEVNNGIIKLNKEFKKMSKNGKEQMKQ